MANYEQMLEQLQKKHSLEDIAENYVLPHNLSKEDEAAARKEFVELRMLRGKNMSEKEHLLSGLPGIKYRIKSYLEESHFDPPKTLGAFLKNHLQITAKKQKELAEDIGIHPSRLNRILHGKEKIGKALAYRLESHSGDLIPAIYWWKLAQMEIEHEMRTQDEERLAESPKVKTVAWPSP